MSERPVMPADLSIGSTCAGVGAPIIWDWRCGCGADWTGYDHDEQIRTMRDHAATVHAGDEFFDWFLQRT